jgi:hypothetical protein
MKLTIHALKDPGAGIKQIRYLERYLWIGKQTGVLHFMDCLDILSTYPPLFPPARNTLLSELTDIKKAEILYDFLPHYFKKKKREANTEPI